MRKNKSGILSMAIFLSMFAILGIVTPDLGNDVSEKLNAIQAFNPPPKSQNF